MNAPVLRFYFKLTPIIFDKPSLHKLVEKEEASGILVSRCINVTISYVSRANKSRGYSIFETALRLLLCCCKQPSRCQGLWCVFHTGKISTVGSDLACKLSMKFVLVSYEDVGDSFTQSYSSSRSGLAVAWVSTARTHRKISRLFVTWVHITSYPLVPESDVVS